MKVPWYETSPGALVALLNLRDFDYCDLYTIYLIDGTILYYCSADVDIVAGATTWKHGLLMVDSLDHTPQANWKTGLDIDTWPIYAMPRLMDPISGAAYPDKINGVPWGEAVVAGALDYAQVKIDRAYLPQWPGNGALVASPTGIVTLFFGLVADIDDETTNMTINIVSPLNVLSRRYPRNTFQAHCSHTLFDIGCTLNSASFATPGTVNTCLNNLITYTPSGSIPGSGSCTLGKITMTSGLCSGLSRTIRNWVAGSVTMISPFPRLVAPGDTFNLYPGCDKSMVQCTAFVNIPNFGGEPFIPAAETAL